MIKQDWMIIVAGEQLVDELEREQKETCELTVRGYDSKQLVALQIKQSNRGIIGVKVVESIYGWTVRYDSGLQNFSILAGKRQGNLDGTLEAAIEFCKKWVDVEPSKRYAWMHKQ